MSYLLMDVEFANQSVSADVLVTFMLIVIMTSSSLMTNTPTTASTASTAGIPREGDDEKEKEPAWVKRVCTPLIEYRLSMILLLYHSYSYSYSYSNTNTNTNPLMYSLPNHIHYIRIYNKVRRSGYAILHSILLLSLANVALNMNTIAAFIPFFFVLYVL